MRNRGFLRCAPLDDDILGSLMLRGVPATCTPLALLFLDTDARPDAVLVSIRASGVLAAWTGGAIKQIDQRKARAALEAMDPNGVSEMDQAEIAQTLKDWRATAGMTQTRAAQVLGLPARTYEGIEAGRGFKYPRLLMLALAAFRN